MIPRLLDKEFLPLKPTFKHLRLSEAGRKFSVPGAEIFRPRDGNFPSLGWKFSVRPLRVLGLRTGVAKCPPYLLKKTCNFSIEFCRRRGSNRPSTDYEPLALPTELSERCLKSTYNWAFI